MTDKGFFTSDEQIRISRNSLPLLNSTALKLLDEARVLLIPSEDYDSTNGADVMALSFARKQREHIMSVLSLIRVNAHRDAALIARTMFEGQVMLKWAFADEPTRTDLWFWFGAVLDWRQTLDNEAAGREVDLEEKRELREYVDRYGSNYHKTKVRKNMEKAEASGVAYSLPDDPWGHQWTEMSVDSMAREVDAGDLYASFYRRTSEWAHWGPRAILMAGDSVTGESEGSDSEDWRSASQALTAGCSSLLTALEILDRHFSLGRANQIKELSSELLQSLNAVMTKERNARHPHDDPTA